MTPSGATADSRHDILVFGGTTEGRSVVKVLEQASRPDGSTRPYLYSTLTASQQIATPNGVHITGALTAPETVELCRHKGVRLIVDAAHPFASGLHRTVAEAAAELGLPVIRYERRPTPVALTEGVVWCDDFPDAIRLLEAAGVERLLALTGVRTIPKLRAFWTRHECRFRILDRPESVAEAVSCGFPREGLLFRADDESELDTMRREASYALNTPSTGALSATPNPNPIPALSHFAVLTKESGSSGGFLEKVAAARTLGLPLYAVRRPAMPDGFHTVYTEAGLRRRIEELLPDGYFLLRSGYTTGTCATAAAVAALQAILYRREHSGRQLPEATSTEQGAPPQCGISEVSVTLPGGETATLPVARLSFIPLEAPTLAAPILQDTSLPTLAAEVVPPSLPILAAEATVVKDAGDDPDVTNGCEITARVVLRGSSLPASDALDASSPPRISPEPAPSALRIPPNSPTPAPHISPEPAPSGAIRFLQGEGVGRVTLPGLGLAVGEPAINPVPRKMIRDNFAALGITAADVTISVKDGAQLAKKTFNPRLGVEGGISIIGTSGIVQPFSDEAFVETIEREIAVARAVGCRELVINSGARSEAAVRSALMSDFAPAHDHAHAHDYAPAHDHSSPDLPPQAFVHYGNAIGETLRAAARAGFRRVTMGVMIGKAVKLAEGRLDTHSRSATMNRDFLIRLAAEAGCSPDARRHIESIALARELWTSLSAFDRALLMPALLAACHRHCSPLLPEGHLSILLISEEGEIPFRV